MTAPAVSETATRAVLVQWRCEPAALSGDGSAVPGAPQELTVGGKFLLRCEGPPAALEKEKIGLNLPQEAKYQLRILETRRLTDTEAEFVVTSWQSGKIELNNPIIDDGSTQVGLGPVQFTVASVLNAETNPEGKPVPPFGPLNLAWPWWVWGSFALALAILIGALGVKLARVLRRRRLLAWLEKNPIVGEPYHQFNKEMRRITRHLPLSSGAWSASDKAQFLKEISEALRWYMARVLIVPVENRTSQEIQDDIRRQDRRLYEKAQRELVVAWTELERAARVPAELKMEDAIQLIEIARSLVERIHAERGRGR